jgi:hypothetical protein
VADHFRIVGEEAVSVGVVEDAADAHFRAQLNCHLDHKISFPLQIRT